MFWYEIYATMLLLLEYLAGLIDILAGAAPVLFNGEPVFLYDMLLMISPVSMIFWGVTLIGVALAIVFSIGIVTQKAMDLKVEKTLGMTLGHIAKSLSMFMITPLMVLGLLQIVSVVMRKTDELFDLASGGIGIGRTIFAMTASRAALEDMDVINRFASGALDFNNYYHVTHYLNVDYITMWIGIPIAAALIAVYFTVMIVFTLRLFTIILLYIISPLFVSSIVLDDGQKYKIWRSTILGKMLSGYSLLIAMKLVTYLLLPFITSDVQLSTNPVGNVFLMGVLVFGCSYGAYKSAGVLPKLIAPGAAGGDDDSMMMGMTTGFVMAAGKKSIAMAIHAVGEAAKLVIDTVRTVIKWVVKIVIAVLKTIFMGQIWAVPKALLSIAIEAIRKIIKRIKQVIKTIIGLISWFFSTIISLTGLSEPTQVYDGGEVKQDYEDDDADEDVENLLNKPQEIYEGAKDIYDKGTNLYGSLKTLFSSGESDPTKGEKASKEPEGTIDLLDDDLKRLKESKEKLHGLNADDETIAFYDKEIARAEREPDEAKRIKKDTEKAEKVLEKALEKQKQVKTDLSFDAPTEDNEEKTAVSEKDTSKKILQLSEKQTAKLEKELKWLKSTEENMRSSTHGNDAIIGFYEKERVKLEQEIDEAKLFEKDLRDRELTDKKQREE
ncbi:MAG: hypothetical protein FWB91_03235 [Defluviitaleaceae bacterium]|nr:hypothetical protein [Defluviitaleaceae bacterium]